MNDTPAATTHDTPAIDRSLAGKYLTCHIGAEEYCLAILSVQEIIAMMRITRVPRVPHAILGVINLRGKIIPVVDLRHKFDMEPIVPTKQSCIVVVTSRGITNGIVVDRVTEVIDLPAEAIEKTPELAVNVHAEFVLGLGKVDERVLLLLDIDRLLTLEEASACEVAAESTECSVGAEAGSNRC